MCYNCTSLDNAACADPMGTNVTMTTCATDVSACVKVVTSLSKLNFRQIISYELRFIKI